MFIRPCLLKVTVKTQPNSAELHLEPSMDTIRGVVRNCFKKIIDVTHHLKQIQSLMFPELKGSRAHLHAVSEEEEPVQKIIQKGMATFENNLIGPIKYLSVYERYHYLLRGEEWKALEDFMGEIPPPFMKDCIKRIHVYEGLRDETIMLRRSIPLNFMSLECGELNDVLYQICDDLRMYIVNDYATKNHDHNRAYVSHRN